VNPPSAEISWPSAFLRLEHLPRRPAEKRLPIQFPGGEQAVLALNVQSTAPGPRFDFSRIADPQWAFREQSRIGPKRRRFGNFLELPAWHPWEFASAIRAGSATLKDPETIAGKASDCGNRLGGAEADIA